jgi:hypothetical protein
MSLIGMLFGADAAAPPDAMRLGGTTETTLARSLSALLPDERGWTTFAEARFLVSSKGAQYAFGATDQDGRKSIESFAAGRYERIRVNWRFVCFGQLLIESEDHRRLGASKEAVVALLGTDDFFGEGCLAEQMQRISTVTACIGGPMSDGAASKSDQRLASWVLWNGWADGHPRRARN